MPSRVVHRFLGDAVKVASFLFREVFALASKFECAFDVLQPADRFSQRFQCQHEANLRDVGRDQLVG